MKRCALCGFEASGEATCPLDGEASWIDCEDGEPKPVKPAPLSAPSESKDEGPAKPADHRPAWRSKRR